MFVHLDVTFDLFCANTTFNFYVQVRKTRSVSNLMVGFVWVMPCKAWQDQVKFISPLCNTVDLFLLGMEVCF